jgi:hypothetical protein
VLPDGVDRAMHLPGDIIVLPRGLIESATGPEAVAGAALIEGQRMKALDPMIPLLEHAGLRATFQLLTTAEMPDAALQGYAEVALKAVPSAVSDTALLAAFEAAQIPASPYAFAVDPEGKVTSGLIEGDPFKGLSPTPLVPDEDWVALQAICSG